jgi:hypothetical protein
VSRLLLSLLAALLLASGAGAYLIANSLVGARYVFEAVPANRRPMNFSVDTEPVPGVANPLGVVQSLMDQWNSIVEATPPFGVATAGGPYNGATVGDTFGTFPNTRYEVAWDDTGEIFAHFGIGPNVLGITLKSVDADRGQILDVLVVVNTHPGALVAPGTGATAEDLLRGTLVHELGHATGIAHSATGFATPATFGLGLMAPQQIPSMFPFRLPQMPQEGATLERDDAAALIDIYPLDTDGLGSISGTVKAASGAGVNQIAVRAIGPAGVGESHIGVLTNEDAAGVGRFTIPNLVPGAYRVLVEAVNGRASVSGESLASNPDSLGSSPFLYGGDEFWQPGDTYAPAADDRTAFEFVQVRAGRDTGFLDFILNAQPLVAGAPANGTLVNGDEQLPDAGNGFHFVDYFVFAGAAGQQVTIDAAAVGMTPRLELLRPSDLTVVADDSPLVGPNASVALTLAETGVHTVALSARASTGNPGGTGTYSLTLSGANGPLPPAPPVLPATAVVGASDPGDLAFGSPVCDTPLLQIHLAAPSVEELWIDSLALRAAGTANDALDVAEIALVHDRNGNGRRDGNEPVLATGTFAADDGTVQLADLDLEVDAGGETHLLVSCDISVQSVSSAPQQAAFLWWLLPAALLPVVARRRFVGLLALPLLLAACGGGGGSGCNGAFNPAGAVVTLRVSVDPGGIRAFTPTSDPLVPLALPAGGLASGTLSVSN